MPDPTRRYRSVPGLAGLGDGRISYAERSMPLLSALATRFRAERPFDGMVIAACLHVTAETAVLVRALRSGGALVRLAASNPLSTQDDIAAALGAAGAGRADDADGPDLVLDDGGDLVSTLHTRARPAALDRVRGGCEGTTTGVLRLRRMAADGALAFPVIAASDTPVKRLVDNTRGTGQSVIDGLLRASGVMLAGKVVVVAGFGACGTGIAE